MTDDFDPVTYHDVNDAWGGIQLPPVTAAEAQAICAKLIAKFGDKTVRMPWWFKRVKRSWAAPKGSNTAFGPHPRHGLPYMVHDTSHEVHRQLHPLAKAHCLPHAALEKAMIDHIIAKGLHLPKPKPAKKVKAQPTRAERLAHSKLLLKRWMTKKRRAETAIKKLERQQRGLSRAILMEGAGPN